MRSLKTLDMQCLFTQDKQIRFFFGFVVLMDPHYSPPQTTSVIHFIPTSMYQVQQQLRGIIHGMILRRHEDHHMFIPARQIPAKGAWRMI